MDMESRGMHQAARVQRWQGWEMLEGPCLEQAWIAGGLVLGI